MAATAPASKIRLHAWERLESAKKLIILAEMVIFPSFSGRAAIGVRRFVGESGSAVQRCQFHFSLP
jgi:hypothetical protein